MQQSHTDVDSDPRNMKLQRVRARFANSADLEPLYQHLQSRIASLSIWI